MRILFFNYEYPPLGGGAANATENLMREFSQITDLKIDLVTSSPENKYQLEKIGENIQIHKLPIGKNKNNIHFQSQKDLIIYSIKALFFARKLKKQNNYTLSHSFFTVPCGALSLFFNIFGKLPYIISLRGSDVPGYSDRFSFIYTPLKPIIKLIWKKASFVVANSQDLKDLALKTNNKQSINIIYNGVDINTFHPTRDKKTNDDFHLTVGATRITHRKGINYLIDAIKTLKKKNISIHMDVMGDGNAKKDLQKQVKQLP